MTTLASIAEEFDVDSDPVNAANLQAHVSNAGAYVVEVVVSREVLLEWSAASPALTASTMMTSATAGVAPLLSSSVARARHSLLSISSSSTDLTTTTAQQQQLPSLVVRDALARLPPPPKWRIPHAAQQRPQLSAYGRRGSVSRVLIAATVARRSVVSVVAAAALVEFE